jgi:ribosomal protein L29
MTKKKEDFKKMKTDELKKKLSELRESIRIIHFKAEGSKSKNVKEGKALRKEVAQILTEINKEKISR